MTRAIDIVALVLETFGPPVYVKHQIVHNRHVVSDFEQKGVIFVEDLEKVPEGSRVVFSAHGSPPSLKDEAKKKNLQIIDAVCPLVSKVHLEAKKYSQEGYFIFYIGHRGHPEPVGVLGQVPAGAAVLIETADEAMRIEPPQTEKLIVLTQTTLSFDDTKEIINCLKNRFVNLIQPPAYDICYATQNRQNAVKALAEKTDLILVIGSKESSNSNRLREVAEKQGTTAYLIDDVTKIKNEWLDGVQSLGVTAGASAPDYLVKNVISHFSNPNIEIKELEVVKEKVRFPLPPEVRNLLENINEES